VRVCELFSIRIEERPAPAAFGSRQANFWCVVSSAMMPLSLWHSLPVPSQWVGIR